MNTKNLKAIAPKPTVDLKRLPSKFEGKLVSEKMEMDTYNTECLFWEIDINGEIFRQKYAPSQIGILVQHLENLHIEDTTELIGKTMGFEKSQPSGRNDKEYPRWYPTVILE